MKIKEQLLKEGYNEEFDCFRKQGDFYYPCEYSKCKNYLLIGDGDVEKELAYMIYGTSMSTGESYDNTYCSPECLLSAITLGEVHGFSKY